MFGWFAILFCDTAVPYPFAALLARITPPIVTYRCRCFTLADSTAAISVWYYRHGE